MNHPRLHKQLLLQASYQERDDLRAPAPSLFELPEKVVQFGTGGFLRAFADYFIDRANRQGTFNGRVVVVQSTGSRRAEMMTAQDGLYTLWVRGLVNGQPDESFAVPSALSRALSAKEQWADVLACARNPALELIISNTTEVGVVLDADDAMESNPPRSFPGKLTAFLYERARHFDYAADKGVIVLPCELLEDNGAMLKGIVLALAERWRLGSAFAAWIESANAFCNTLVDRIVPGMPPPDERAAREAQFGYEDDLLTVAEVYRLWAIEGDAALRQRLGFADADPGVLVAGDIAPYRIRKIRILNGGHTLTVPLGFLLGNTTVLDNMNNPLTGPFIEALLREEIGPTLEVAPATVPPYIDEVLARWRNPFLQHHLIDITLHSTSKMRVRVMPSLLRHYAQTGGVPHRMALGFAAYLLFMRGTTEDAGRVYGEHNGTRYPINDAKASFFLDAWPAPSANHNAVDCFVDRICADESLWGANLTRLPGFADAVVAYLTQMLDDGVEAAVRAVAGLHDPR